MVSESLARRARQNQNLVSGRRPGQPSLTTMQELENAKKASDLSKQITRRWKAGDVYAPHDLSAAEMAKWRNREGPKYDVFDVLGFNPLENYRVRSPLPTPFLTVIFIGFLPLQSYDSASQL
jgi:small subunit ribosomal protein S18